MHYAGTLALLAVLAWGAISGWWWAVLFALPALYAPAWFSHFFIEHNKPATFTYPAWSLASDFRMTALAAVGRIGAEYERYQLRPQGR